MSILLRIELVIIAIGFLGIVIYTVNKKQLWLQYSFLWLSISGGMLLVAIFPNLIVRFTKHTGIKTPVNLIYLLGIIVLLIISFYLTTIISKQSEQIKRLVQMVSIEKYLYERDDRDEKSKSELSQNDTMH